MADSKRRTRAVIFRLTQEEYNTVKSSSSAGGARSISEFARTNVLRMADEPSLRQVQKKLDALHQAVKHLSQKLDRS